MVSTSLKEAANNKKISNTIKDVEDFIEKMRNQDIMILYERARSINVDKDNKEPLSQALASSLTTYEMLGKGAFLFREGKHRQSVHRVHKRRLHTRCY
jgi:hypothetical protein